MTSRRSERPEHIEDVIARVLGDVAERAADSGNEREEDKDMTDKQIAMGELIRLSAEQLGDRVLRISDAMEGLNGAEGASVLAGYLMQQQVEVRAVLMTILAVATGLEEASAAKPAGGFDA